MIALYAAAAVVLVTPASELLHHTVDMSRLKLQRLEASGRPPHLIVVSGSNALYSVNSRVLAQEVGRPVTNAAMQWNFALLALEDVADRVRPGDWVLLPLEWEFWDEENTPAGARHRTPLEACYVIAHRRERLQTVGEWALALWDCNPRTLMMGMRQRLMKLVGFRFPPSGMEALITPEGDILENTPDKATFAALLRPVPQAADGRTVGSTRDSGAGLADAAGPDLPRYPRIQRAINRIQAAGGRVFIGYPVSVRPIEGFYIPGTAPLWLTPAWEAGFRRWVASTGADLISSVENHQFPPDCFFDMGFHLHRGCNAENTRRYAREILRRISDQPR